MTKTTITLTLLFCLAVLPQASAEVKKITLKDGSMIRGEVVSMSNGLYTVKTENMGEVLLSESNIVSVVNESLANAQQALQNQAQALQQPAAAASAPAGNNSFANQVNAMQGQIMANPQSMEAIQAMASDPEISAMMADPQFLQELTAAMSGNNPEAIANNPKVKQLMNNPKMQALIQQMGGSTQ